MGDRCHRPERPDDRRTPRPRQSRHRPAMDHRERKREARPIRLRRLLRPARHLNVVPRRNGPRHRHPFALLPASRRTGPVRHRPRKTRRTQHQNRRRPTDVVRRLMGRRRSTRVTDGRRLRRRHRPTMDARPIPRPRHRTRQRPKKSRPRHPPRNRVRRTRLLRRRRQTIRERSDTDRGGHGRIDARRL